MKRQREPSQPRKASSAFPNDPQPNPKNGNTNHDEVLLTPHTVRLMKLIQDGSEEHASMAALQLTTITAQSSPLILWDVLGRLQAFLVDENWQTRQNASGAMQGVARHLPLKSRQQFLEDVQSTKQGCLWLTLGDFQQELESIIQQGRLLWSHSECDEEKREEEMLQQMDQRRLGGVSSNDSDADFVQRRVQWQRRVLAQRIGLSGLLQATGNLPESCLSDTITAEDLKPSATVSNFGANRPTKKGKRAKQVAADSKETQRAQAVRALLVLEIKKEQEAPNGMPLSHENPQRLLATELLYRVFDPSWHVRHGALMGMLGLLRAWHGSVKASDKFGAWPQDIMVRCLCILVLDRFGDYSGTTTSGAKAGSESGSVVAPVRETAGQLLSMAWHFAPASIQEETLSLLYRISRGETGTRTIQGQEDDRSLDWEIRHGSLVGIKYIVAVQGASSSHMGSNSTIGMGIPKAAMHCLADNSDDAQSVAAQILSALLTSPDQQDWKEEAFVQVCKALTRTRTVSSSILDLMNLCSDLLHNMVVLHSSFSAAHVTPAAMLGIFTEYLDHDLASVRLAALRSIDNCIEAILGNKGNTLADENIIAALDKVHERIFDSFFQYGACQEPLSHSLEVNRQSEPRDAFASFRSSAWSKLTLLVQERAHREGQLRSTTSLVSNLTFKYFDVSPAAGQAISRLGRKDRLSFLRGAADALSDIFWLSQGPSPRIAVVSHLELFELSIKTFLHSAWSAQCEGACLLFRAIAKKVARGPDTVNGTLSNTLTACQQSIYSFLTAGNVGLAPSCLAADQCNQTKELLQDQGLVLMRDSAFLNGVEILRKSKSNDKIEDGVTAIQALWKQAIVAKGGQERIFATDMRSVATTISSMRLLSIMAGAVISGNQVAPLEKVTPVIRPLMTSLKNETNLERRSLSCDFAAELLSMMYANVEVEQNTVSPFLKAREKVLGTMCEAISSRTCEGADGSSTLARDQPFDRVVQLFLRAISNQITSMESLQPVWLILRPLVGSPDKFDSVERSLNLLEAVSGALGKNCALAIRTILDILPTVVLLACRHNDERSRAKSSKIVHMWCSEHTEAALPVALPSIVQSLEDKVNDAYRLSACALLLDLVQAVGLDLCPFVRSLLRLVMSLMADPLPSCARMANGIFACLVRVAPLVACDTSPTHAKADGRYDEGSVVEHLIHGRPLPPYSLPTEVKIALSRAGITLRRYQMEGITWLRFLQGVNLNGALCDSMGLGKTLQALIGVAIAHVDGVFNSEEERPKSLVVCPSSVVGHWEAEIEKFFPGRSIFTSLAFIGSSRDRKALWKQSFENSNIIVTSYSVLRTDVEILSKPFWRFCILDEGHLIRNPKTATAKAARCIRANHKLLLSGTPVQNKVQEIFAAFDFLMPNFLGSPSSFAKEFANPITKSHLPGATADKINHGIEQLKILHQQVLPFILRREKEEVLKELPPKNISTIPCEMSSVQRQIYEQFLATEEAKKSIEELQRALQGTSSSSEALTTDGLNIGSAALKTLLFLRLLCTHPLLVEGNGDFSEDQGAFAYNMDMSGKFVALAELLRACGIHQDQVTGADNDTSVLYCNPDEEDGYEKESDLCNLLDAAEPDDVNGQQSTVTTSKALVFAQFTQSLDALEELLVKRHMPSVRYLRLDGRVPPTRRTALVDAFNNDPSIKLMLLTTRVGGLGLNLTGADTVIFLENDFNPFADMQAADRAHRIGQAKTVNVYRLVTKNTIEERIMSIQEKKIALSKAIVNTENSTLFSMGTDRLLDIFTCRTDSQKKSEGRCKSSGSAENGKDYNLDALVDNYKDEYSALSLKGFIQALKN